MYYCYATLSKAPAKLIIQYAKFDTKRIFVFSDTNLLYSVGSTTNRSGLIWLIGYAEN